VAAPTEVFQLCHDVDRRPEWDERVSRVELISGSSIRRGTLVRIDVTTSRGPLFTWEGEYADYQFPSRSSVRVLDAAPSSYFESGSETWEVRKSNGDTRITVIWEYEPRGFLRRILDVVRKGVTRSAIRRSLIKLKKILEEDIAIEERNSL
jgi:hypothetical protein